MAHELDDHWTLFFAADDGSGNYDPMVSGSLFLKIGQNGNVDRMVSRHDPGDGSTPTELDGKVMSIGTGYRVRLFEHLIVGGAKLRRPLIGGLIARINGQLIMGGTLLRDQPEKTPPRARGKKGAATAGQEEGTWVATKP